MHSLGIDKERTLANCASDIVKGLKGFVVRDQRWKGAPVLFRKVKAIFWPPSVTIKWLVLRIMRLTS